MEEPTPPAASAAAAATSAQPVAKSSVDNLSREELQQQVRKQLKLLQMAKAKVDEANAEAAALKKQLGQAQEQHQADVASLREQHSAELAQRQTRMEDQHEHQRTAAEAEANGLRQRGAALEAELAQLKEERQQQQQQQQLQLQQDHTAAAAAAGEQARLSDAQANKQDDAAALNEARAAAETAMAAQTAMMTKLAQMEASHKERAEADRQTIQQLQASVASIQQTAERARQDAVNAEKQLAAEAEELANAGTNAQRLREEVANKSAELADSAARIQLLEQQVLQLKADAQQRQTAAASDVAVKYSVMALEMADQQKTIDDMAKEAAALAEQLQAAHDTAAKAQTSVDELTVELTNAQTASTEKDERAGKLKMLLVKAKKEIAEQKAGLEAAATQQGTMQTKWQEAEQNANALQLQLANALRDYEALTQQVEHERAAAQRTQQQLEEMLDATNSRAENSEATLRALQDDYKQYKIRVHTVLKRNKAAAAAAGVNESSGGEPASADAATGHSEPQSPSSSRQEQQPPQQQAQQLLDQITALHDEVQQHRQRSLDLAAQLTKSEAAVQELEAAASQHAQEREHHQDQLRELESELILRMQTAEQNHVQALELANSASAKEREDLANAYQTRFEEQAQLFSRRVLERDNEVATLEEQVAALRGAGNREAPHARAESPAGHGASTPHPQPPAPTSAKDDLARLISNLPTASLAEAQQQQSPESAHHLLKNGDTSVPPTPTSVTAGSEASAMDASSDSRALSGTVTPNTMAAAASDALASVAKLPFTTAWSAISKLSTSVSGAAGPIASAVAGPGDSTAKFQEAQAHIRYLLDLLEEHERAASLGIQQQHVLKEEIRRLERNEERVRQELNLEFLKNIVLKFLETKGNAREHLIPVLSKLLQLSPDEERSLKSTLAAPSLSSQVATAVTSESTWSASVNSYWSRWAS